MNKRDEEKADARLPFQFLPSAKHRHDPGTALSKVEGVYFAGGHKGVVALGDNVGELSLAADGSIRIRAAATPPPLPLVALRSTGNLPGNLRYTRDRLGAALVADTQVDGETHLPHTFQSLRRAMLRTLQGDVAAAAEPLLPPVERETVHQALSGLPWAGEGVVEQEDSWELRPRLRGDPVPVRVTIEAGGLRLSRVVLYQLPASGTAGAEAVADQAVQINARLRHARLAVRDGRLVAEARLDSLLIQPDWLALTACAVAVAARYAATPLRLLAEQPPVADTYIMMFCSIGEQPAPDGVGG